MKKLFRLEGEGLMARGDLSRRWYTPNKSGSQETQVFHLGITRKGSVTMVCVVILWLALLVGWRRNAA